MDQTPVRSVDPEGIDKLFGDDPAPDAQGDGEAAQQDEHVKSIEDENHPIEEAKPADPEKVVEEEAPVDLP